MTLSPTTTTDSNASASPPFTRDSSPSPSLSPTPALSACPKLDRSFSATSSASTFSRQSTTSRSSSASAALRKRGYVRPQGATFSDSARNRDSVLSLGSIAHLQYYFARTGLLDGKGGQLAKELKKKPTLTDSLFNSASQTHACSDIGSPAEETVDSPVEEEETHQNWDESMMLPPTVSTYSHRVHYLPPPPDSETLRNDLINALREAEKVLDQVEGSVSVLDRQKDSGDVVNEKDFEQGDSPVLETPSSWHEIQGLNILDVVTLAIRAAKIYYTAHEHPQRLCSIKSERQIREELLSVLDVLKRMAGRNFAGGIKQEELGIVQSWVKDIENFIAEEQVIEKQEAQDRENWKWLDGSWTGREREREWLFMCSFLPEGTLPEWTISGPNGQRPTPFLQSLRSGLTLVMLSNTILKRSKRQFGEIKAFHTDTAKPYRCAENLRYWIKAAELRWETRLKVDVTGVVHSKTAAWTDFDAAILQWSQVVREELTKEWRECSVPLAGSKLSPNLQAVEGIGRR
ncbi:hypothetical protein MMC07_002407 [Pseudocyphellaria aurata]|nr:hypothetical protein [Pseudocyphellaria aurata]